MEPNELPERWIKTLQKYLRETRKVDRNQLSPLDFGSNECVRLNLDDRSTAFFHAAFYIIDHENSEVAVFTKYSGAHVFPLVGTNVEMFDCKGSE